MVVAIIGFLASVVLTSLNQARVKARDATRISDIHQLQNALEIYATEHNNLYPSPGSITYVNNGSSLASKLTPKYIATLPEDPTRTGSFRYRYATQTTGSSDQTGYIMLVDFERDGDGLCYVLMPLHTSAVETGTINNWKNGPYPACP